MSGNRNEIETLKNKMNLSYADIAEKSDLTSVYIWSLAKGKRTNPSKEVMERIAKVLNKTVQEVFFPDDV